MSSANVLFRWMKIVNSPSGLYKGERSGGPGVFSGPPSSGSVALDEAWLPDLTRGSDPSAAPTLLEPLQKCCPDHFHAASLDRNQLRLASQGRYAVEGPLLHASQDSADAWRIGSGAEWFVNAEMAMVLSFSSLGVTTLGAEGVAARPSVLLSETAVRGLRLPMPPSDPSADELAWMMGLKSLRSDAVFKAEIEAQAESTEAAVWPVESVITGGEDPAGIDFVRMLRQLVLSNLAGPLFAYKLQFGRARPGEVDPRIAPLFSDPNDWRNPRHPSYPSAHAAQAYALAFLFGALTTDDALKATLMAAATRVAVNREIAGLHYPSDSEAGRLLAKQVVDALMASTYFSSLARTAWAEFNRP